MVHSSPISLRNLVSCSESVKVQKLLNRRRKRCRKHLLWPSGGHLDRGLLAEMAGQMSSLAHLLFWSAHQRTKKNACVNNCRWWLGKAVCTGKLLKKSVKLKGETTNFPDSSQMLSPHGRLKWQYSVWRFWKIPYLNNSLFACYNSDSFDEFWAMASRSLNLTNVSLRFEQRRALLVGQRVENCIWTHSVVSFALIDKCFSLSVLVGIRRLLPKTRLRVNHITFHLFPDCRSCKSELQSADTWEVKCFLVFLCHYTKLLYDIGPFDLLSSPATRHLRTLVIVLCCHVSTRMNYSARSHF